jgi:SAM-dependent methyltransferase
VERDRHGLALARVVAPGAPLVEADASRLPLQAGTADAAVVLDVLEHGDDGAVVAEVARVLRPGGVAVVSVPAMPWLWSERDVRAGHLRRYDRAGIVRLLTGRGLLVERVRHFQFLLSPLFVASRLLSRRRPGAIAVEDRPRPVVNRVLGAVNRLEVALGRVVPWPWGSSVVVVCRRP